MTTQNKLYTLLLVTLTMMMAACSPKSGDDGTSTSSSTATTTTTATSSAYAACNAATSTNGSLVLNIEALKQSTTGTILPDMMRVKLSTVPAAYSNNANYFQMWRWQVSSSGQTNLDPTPVNFRLENISTGVALTDYVSSMRWSDISAIATTLGATTPAQLFALTRFQVDTRDTTAAYQVLKVVYYDTSSNASVDQLDVLMPLFAVLPSAYAVQPDGSARPTILQNLHPFKSMASSTLAQLSTIANSYCF